MAKKQVYLVETKSKSKWNGLSVAKKKVYLVETKSPKEMNGNEIDNWDGLDRFTVPKDSKEIRTTPVEKKDGCGACGYNNPISGEISGGTEAVSNEFPWTVRITGGCAGGELQLGWDITGNIISLISNIIITCKQLNIINNNNI